MENQKREFTGVWIPRHIIEDEELTMSEMMVYAEIASFIECYKSNEKLGERYKLKANTISIIVSNLIRKGYVESKGMFQGRYRVLVAKTEEPNQRQGMIKIKPTLSLKSKGAFEKNHTIDNKEEYIIENNKLQTTVATERGDFFQKSSPTKIKNSVDIEKLLQNKINSLTLEGVSDNFLEQERLKFISYWTESNAKGKQRWEGEKYFDVSRRFATWISRAKEYSAPKRVTHEKAPRRIVRI